MNDRPFIKNPYTNEEAKEFFNKISSKREKMKAGDKFVKDGKVIEVFNIKDNYFDDGSTLSVECVWFWCKEGSIHVITEHDFLEQYTPYKPVEEYQWAFKRKTDTRWTISDTYLVGIPCLTSDEADYQRLDFTKRERVQ